MIIIYCLHTKCVVHGAQHQERKMTLRSASQFHVLPQSNRVKLARLRVASLSGLPGHLLIFSPWEHLVSIIVTFYYKYKADIHLYVAVYMAIHLGMYIHIHSYHYVAHTSISMIQWSTKVYSRHFSLLQKVNSTKPRPHCL